MWVYSRINFLFQYDDSWSQKNLASLLGIKSKTISSTASKIMDSLRIDYFDGRFARKEVAESNPLNKFIMTKEEFIVDKEMVKEQIINTMFKENLSSKYFEEDEEVKEIKQDEI